MRSDNEALLDMRKRELKEAQYKMARKMCDITIGNCMGFGNISGWANVDWQEAGALWSDICALRAAINKLTPKETPDAK
ncbi:hypothetical protein LCGC14_1320240 [marine sediment metagenome]|uniref:Uncharacterized protein n=1 Tax=marine sediment metagenome TaxID=412755 RepID=A0A0F9KKA0_9ZZZZ